MDFAVRAPSTRAADSAWLGPAIAELLQAKMQLFAGARVLERQRVRSYLRAAPDDASAAAEDPGALARTIPAEVLIAGSVSIDPRDPRRIRVQARAFEVESAMIVSEATFTGTADLPGLLRIAEDLARTLADGLKFAYTPEQLAYAEPAKLDTLRLFVEGEGHLAAGRHRKAIESFQRALEGNEGRYYAAAHRLQGEAYQGLAKVSAAEQQPAVREEYLKKFKEDALAASGALYDLGLAYEANGMWQEGIGAFEDYLSAAGGAADTIRWSHQLHGDLTWPEGFVKEPTAIPDRHCGYSVRTVIPRAFVDSGRLHFVVHFYDECAPEQAALWASLVSLDAATGAIEREVDLKKLLFPQAGETIPTPSLMAFEGDVFFLAWEESGSTWLAAVEPSKGLRWKTDLKTTALWFRSAKTADALILMSEPDRPQPHTLIMVDNSRGEVLKRIDRLNVLAVDVTGARLAVPEGFRDLRTDRIVSYPEQWLDERRTEHLRSGEIPLFAGRPGVFFVRRGEDTLLLREQGGPLLVKNCTLVSEPREGQFVHTGPLLCTRRESDERGRREYPVIVDPETGAQRAIYADLVSGVPPKLVARTDSLLAFSLAAHPAQTYDPRYSLPTADETVVLNVIDAGTGDLLLKHRVGWYPTALHDVCFVDGEMLLRRRTTLLRLRARPAGSPLRVAAAEANYHIAAGLLKLGNATAAEKRLALFASQSPGDPRAMLLRMRLAARARKSDIRSQAGEWALRALVFGVLDEAERTEALTAVQALFPEVERAIFTPLKSRLTFRSILEPGWIVCASDDGKVHLLLDPLTGDVRITPTPGVVRNESEDLLPTAYHDRHLFQVTSDGRGATGLVRIDLFTGERVTAPLPGSPAISGFVPGMGLLLQVGSGAGRRLVKLDGAALEPLSWIVPPFDGYDVTGGFHYGDTYHDSERLLALVDRPMANSSLPLSGDRVGILVLDKALGVEVGRLRLELTNEHLAEVALDEDTLYLALAGADRNALIAGAHGTWARILAVTAATGEQRWSVRIEGVLAGEPVLEGDRVAIPVFEGQLPAAIPWEGRGMKGRQITGRDLPLKKLRLDRRTGDRVGEQLFASRGGGDASDRDVVLLNDQPWQDPKNYAMLFGMSELAFCASRPRAHHRYRIFQPEAPPQQLLPLPPGTPHVLVESALPAPGAWKYPTWLMLWGNKVFESAGGGVILVKEAAGGKGVRMISPTGYSSHLSAGQPFER